MQNAYDGSTPTGVILVRIKTKKEFKNAIMKLERRIKYLFMKNLELGAQLDDQFERLMNLEIIQNNIEIISIIHTQLILNERQKNGDFK